MSTDGLARSAGCHADAFSRVLLLTLALLVSFGLLCERARAQGPPCMGDRPALFARSLPESAIPGQAVTLTGVGLSHYQSPIIAFFQRPRFINGGERWPDTLGDLVATTLATIQSDTILTFRVPPYVLPFTYQLYAMDQNITDSPAVCMRMANGVFAGTYTVAKDADCGTDLLMCFAARDYLTSLTYATLEVLPPPLAVSVTITNAGGTDTNPLCPGTPVVTQAGAYFDAGPQNGVVDGIQSSGLATVNFPADLVVNVLSSNGYDILPGNMYASDNAGMANLVVVAKFYSCPHNSLQFVAAHFRLTGRNLPSWHLIPIKMLAGDLASTIRTQEGSQRGVVMSGNFDGTLDQVKSNWSLIEGRAVGTVTQGTLQITYGARIEFTFSVREELH